MKNAKVKDYMSTTVVTVTPDQKITEVLELMNDTNHDGFPVVEGEDLVGIITSRDVMLHGKGDKVANAMSREVMVTYPETNLLDAARVMFRRGYSRLPVVDEEKRLVGIVTNTDVIRSHIERATPGKVRKLTESLEKLYSIRTVVRLGTVKIRDLRPTQNRIQPDEFQGREYELKRGLAEPIVVIKTGDRQILVDGHHRALAALKLGIDEFHAYIIILSRDIELGLEKTARAMGLKSISDIKVGEDAEHGIAEIITSRGVSRS
jgi:IMP dehydrogenase